MFNYIKETIINDANIVIADGAKEGKASGVLVIKRGANYDMGKICGAKIYKTMPVVGEVGSITIDFAKLTSTGVDYRLFNIFVSTPSKEFVEFAYPHWKEFGKPIVVETAATNADELAAAFRLAQQPDNPFYKVTVDGTNVVLTFAESWMNPKEVNILEHKVADGSQVVLEGAATIINSVEEFGTGKWLVENLRFPSYPNMRFTPLYSDEAPVKGGKYVQYAFQYLIERSVPGGLSSVGQKVDSITSHVLYVLESEVDTFEAEVNKTGYTVTYTAVPASQTYKYEGTVVAGSATTNDPDIA